MFKEWEEIVLQQIPKKLLCQVKVLKCTCKIEVLITFSAAIELCAETYILKDKMMKKIEEGIESLESTQDPGI